MAGAVRSERMGVGRGTSQSGSRPHWLKLLRVIVAAIFFGGLTSGFLDLSNRMPAPAIGALAWPQFLPSLLRWIAAPGVAAAGFILVIAATLIFGRIYCSAICPLGILQDGFSRASGWFGGRQRHRFSRPGPRVQLLILAIAVVLLALGHGGLLGFLDPFSAFGRIVGDIGRPIFAAANNIVADMLGAHGIYHVYRVDLRGVSYMAMGLAVILLLVPVLFAITRGRLYCNSICPVGTLLGLVSRLSVFRVVIDRARCIKCGDCLAVCKAECIDLRSGLVDAARCVECFNCLDTCSEAGVAYRIAGRAEVGRVESRPGADLQRRREFLGAALLIAGGGCLAGTPVRAAEKKAVPGDALRAAAAKPTRVPEVKHWPVSAPGSFGIARFNGLCTACHLCVTACPSHVLKPALTQYGLAGFLQPHMDFIASFCEYDCIRCGEVCPTGAILPLSRDAKRLVQMGRVVFIKDNCVVNTANTACGSCAEHCPTQAVHMVPFKDKLTIPEIDPERCVGCGACEHVCPTRPYRAIYVDGNRNHLAALPPTREKVDQTVPKEFPF